MICALSCSKNGHITHRPSRLRMQTGCTDNRPSKTVSTANELERINPAQPFSLRGTFWHRFRPFCFAPVADSVRVCMHVVASYVFETTSRIFGRFAQTRFRFAPIHTRRAHTHRLNAACVCANNSAKAHARTHSHARRWLHTDYDHFPSRSVFRPERNACWCRTLATHSHQHHRLFCVSPHASLRVYSWPVCVGTEWDTWRLTRSILRQFVAYALTFVRVRARTRSAQFTSHMRTHHRTYVWQMTTTAPPPPCGQLTKWTIYISEIAEATCSGGVVGFKLKTPQMQHLVSVFGVFSLIRMGSKYRY